MLFCHWTMLDSAIICISSTLIELEVNDTTDIQKSAFYLNSYNEIDDERVHYFLDRVQLLMQNYPDKVTLLLKSSLQNYTVEYWSTTSIRSNTNRQLKHQIGQICCQSKHLTFEWSRPVYIYYNNLSGFEQSKTCPYQQQHTDYTFVLCSSLRINAESVLFV